MLTSCLTKLCISMRAWIKTLTKNTRWTQSKKTSRSCTKKKMVHLNGWWRRSQFCLLRSTSLRLIRMRTWTRDRNTTTNFPAQSSSKQWQQLCSTWIARRRIPHQVTKEQKVSRSKRPSRSSKTTIKCWFQQRLKMAMKVLKHSLSLSSRNLACHVPSHWTSRISRRRRIEVEKGLTKCLSSWQLGKWRLTV